MEEKINEIMHLWNCSKEEAEDILFDQEIEEGLKENCFCDNTGYCCGASCKYYHKCQG